MATRVSVLIITLWKKAQFYFNFLEMQSVSKQDEGRSFNFMQQMRNQLSRSLFKTSVEGRSRRDLALSRMRS